jgi:hypothetical protein
MAMQPCTRGLVKSTHGNAAGPVRWIKDTFEAGMKSCLDHIVQPGHRGHTSHIGIRLRPRLVQADVTAGPALLFVRNPGWHPGFDMDGALAEQTRRKLYDMAVADKMLIQGFHFPFPAAGYAEKDGAGYRLVPIAWNAML